MTNNLLLANLNLRNAAFVQLSTGSSNCYDCDSGDSCDGDGGCDGGGCDGGNN